MNPKPIFIFFVIVLLNAPLLVYAQTSNERQTFRQYLAELKKNSDNDGLREKIILLSLKIYPPVATPKEYSIHLGNGKKEITGGTSSSNFSIAIGELNKAIEAAPWMPEAYYNIALLYEQYAVLEQNAGYLQKAISNYNYFLLTNPDADKAKKAKESIKDLQTEYGHINKLQEDINKKNQKKSAMRSSWREEYEAALIDGARPSSFFKGASIHVSFRLGLNFPSMPKVANNNADSYTTTKDYYGTGLYAGLEIWPLYGQYFGIGGFADGSYGLSGNISKDQNYMYSNKLTYNYGLNAFLGLRQVKLIATYAMTTTNFSVSTFTAAGWDLPSSKVDFGSTRYGGGLRFNFKKKRKDLELMLLLEKLDYLPTNQKPIQIFHVGYIKSGKSFIQLDIAPNYPIIGNKKFAADNQYKDKGLFINFTIAHSFDFFGRRFKNQNW